MKFTFVLPYAGLQGGIRVIAAYAERLQQRGHEVFVVSTPYHGSLRHAVKSVLCGRGIPQPEPSYFDRLQVPHRVLESIRPVTDADVPDADVVIATYYKTASGVNGLAASKGAKVIFIQGYETEGNKRNPELEASWLMPMHKIVISKWLVQFAQDRFADNNVSHVPNSVDLRQFFALPRSRQERPTVGFLYSSSWFKGCRTSLKAIKRLRDLLPSLRVICFGAERPDVRLPLSPATEFHYRPSQDEIRNLYAQCDLWLCGSNREGFHLPPLEAMACRCPVVSTRVGGPLDIVENGNNGYLVDIGDDEALARRALQVLTCAETEWRAMSDAAFKTATDYTWEDAADRFERALMWAATASTGLQGNLLPIRRSVEATPDPGKVLQGKYTAS